MWPCSSERMAACSLGAAGAPAGAEVAAWAARWASAAGAVATNASPSASTQATESGFMAILLMVCRLLATSPLWKLEQYSKDVYVQSTCGRFRSVGGS